MERENAHLYKLFTEKDPLWRDDIWKSPEEYWGEKQPRQREQKVQRPWGINVLGCSRNRKGPMLLYQSEREDISQKMKVAEQGCIKKNWEVRN